MNDRIDVGQETPVPTGGPGAVSTASGMPVSPSGGGFMLDHPVLLLYIVVFYAAVSVTLMGVRYALLSALTARSLQMMWVRVLISAALFACAYGLFWVRRRSFRIYGLLVRLG